MKAMQHEKSKRSQNTSPWLWLVLLILAEVAFKYRPDIGFFAYAILFLMMALVFLVLQEQVLSFLLAVPVVRIASFGVILEPGLKSLLGVLFLAFLPLMIFLVQGIPLRGFSLERLDYLLTERRSGKWLALALLLGIILGVLWWRLVGNPESTFLMAVIAVSSAFVYELYFRSAVLGPSPTWATVILSSVWFSVLVFSGNFFSGLIALVFSVIAGWAFLELDSVYFSLVAQLAVQLIPVML